MEKKKSFDTDNLKIIPILGMLLFGIIISFIRLHISESGFPLSDAEVFIYVGAIFYWIVTIEKRILDKSTKKYLLIEASLMIVWNLLRVAQNRYFSEVPIVSRYIWYLYYVPMIIIPLMMLFAAWQTKKGDGSYFAEKIVMQVVCLIILVLVFTNDMHQLTFSFKSLEGWDWYQNYSYGPFYMVTVLWIAAVTISAVVTMINNCRIAAVKKKTIYPIMSLVVGLIYSVVYYFMHNKVVLPLNINDVYIFVMLFCCESCIEIGLIPSNTNYKEFFLKLTGIDVEIDDDAGERRYISEGMMDISEEDKEKAKLDEVFLDERTRLTSFEIEGGRAYVTDNLADIVRISEHLKDVKEELEGESELLTAETEMRVRRVKAYEKNKLYDLIAESVKPQVARLERLFKEAEKDKSRLKEIYSVACIFNVYIKRRTNFEIICYNLDSSYLQAFELDGGIRESLEYMRICGITTGLNSSYEGELDREVLIVFYEIFEAVVESYLENMTAMLVNLRVKQRNIDMRLQVEGDGNLSIGSSIGKKMLELAVDIEIENEDGVTYVTVRRGRC